MFPLFFVVSFLWVCSTFQANPCLWYILVLKVGAYSNSFQYVGYTQSRDVNSKSVAWAQLVCCTRNCTRNMNDPKSHCLFTTFRADVKSVPHPLYSSFVVLWGLLWNLKNNPQFAMCICITLLRWTQDWSQVSTWLTSLPHTFPIFFVVWQLAEEARCTKKFCIQNMSLPDLWQTWKERELNYHHL